MSSLGLHQTNRFQYIGFANNELQTSYIVAILFVECPKIKGFYRFTILNWETYVNSMVIGETFIKNRSFLVTILCLAYIRKIKYIFEVNQIPLALNFFLG